MRIVVTGKDGQIDTALRVCAEAMGELEIICLGLPEIDLSDLETLRGPITAARPDVIISSAAYTAVDQAEDEADLAQIINGEAPSELARIAADLNIPILHLSTDYVYAGDKPAPYSESDTPAPVCVYGRTKLSGEIGIAQATPNHVILRTAWVYSPYGRNFVKTMLRMGATHDVINVVNDQWGCPSYAPEIARVLLTIARRVSYDPDPALRGVFHLAGQGETTWAGFADAIFLASAAWGGRPVKVNPVSSAAYPTRASRPANSRLSSEKLSKVYDLRLDPWHVSLEDCLTRLLGVPAGME